MVKVKDAVIYYAIFLFVVPLIIAIYKNWNKIKNGSNALDREVPHCR